MDIKDRVLDVPCTELIYHRRIEAYQESADKRLWDEAVFMLDKELGEMGLECECKGCGGWR